MYVRTSELFLRHVSLAKQIRLPQFYYAERQKNLRYWAFQKECRNCSVLDMIRTTLRDSDATGDKPLFLLPRPRTCEDAIRNLRAFSTEYAQRYRSDPPPNFERIDASSFSYVQINDCLGWIQLRGQLLHTLIRKTKCYECLHIDIPRGWNPDPWYFAIVYKFVPEGAHDNTLVFDHMNFFYQVGFAPEGFREENWRAGILVDFSDLALPFDSSWRERLYGRVIKGEDGRPKWEDSKWRQQGSRGS